MTGKANKPLEFAFGIRVLKDFEDREYCQAFIKNTGVSTEIVAMQLKAYLRLIEDDYVEDFKNNSTQFKQE